MLSRVAFTLLFFPTATLNYKNNSVDEKVNTILTYMHDVTNEIEIISLMKLTVFFTQ